MGNWLPSPILPILSPEVQQNAILLMRANDYSGALRELNRAVELGGEARSIAATLSDTGASLASRGRVLEAEPLIRRALELNPALVQAHRNLALALQDQGQIAEARAALRQAIEATGRRREYEDLTRDLEPGR